MISVVIPTHESERLLVPTLAALVPGALHGLVREVIVADGGSADATAEVADIAGCHFVVMPGPRGARLAQAAESARGGWLWFLQPGSVPDANWIDEVEAFVRLDAANGAARAAVLRRRSGSRRSSLAEAVALIGAALGAQPKPSQGLLIAKSLYQSIGGHSAGADDPETDLLGRLGRRRIVVLGCGITQAG